MVKRLIWAILLAAGGTGVYVFGSGAIAPKSDRSDATSGTEGDQGEGEWQVEYVDGEGNPIQRDTGLRGATGRIKLTSKPFFKRLPGAVAKPVSVTRSAKRSGFDKEGFKRTRGG